MKLQIDTSAKTIKVEQTIKVVELMDTLKKLFPKDEWKEYSLETNTIINWSNPIYIDRWIPPFNPYPIWSGDGAGYQDTNGSMKSTINIPSVFCIETN